MEAEVSGLQLTWHKKPKLKIAQPSRERLTEKIRKTLREARGGSLKQTIERLNPVLRGWVAYFRLAEVKGVLEDLDGWIRRKLRVLLWRQWKQVYTRARNLMRLGLGKVRAWQSATNGQGPWWNGGASHMNQPIRTLGSTKWGWFRCWKCSSASRLFHEPPDAEPHVRWCGRTAGVTPPPTRSVKCGAQRPMLHRVVAGGQHHRSIRAIRFLPPTNPV